MATTSAAVVGGPNESRTVCCPGIPGIVGSLCCPTGYICGNDRRGLHSDYCKCASGVVCGKRAVARAITATRISGYDDFCVKAQCAGRGDEEVRRRLLHKDRGRADFFGCTCPSEPRALRRGLRKPKDDSRRPEAGYNALGNMCQHDGPVGGGERRPQLATRDVRVVYAVEARQPSTRHWTPSRRSTGRVPRRCSRSARASATRPSGRRSSVTRVTPPKALSGRRRQRGLRRRAQQAAGRRGRGLRTDRCHGDGAVARPCGSGKAERCYCRGASFGRPRRSPVRRPRRSRRIQGLRNGRCQSAEGRQCSRGVGVRRRGQTVHRCGSFRRHPGVTAHPHGQARGRKCRPQPATR